MAAPEVSTWGFCPPDIGIIMGDVILCGLLPPTIGVGINIGGGDIVGDIIPWIGWNPMGSFEVDCLFSPSPLMADKTLTGLVNPEMLLSELLATLLSSGLKAFDLIELALLSFSTSSSFSSFLLSLPPPLMEAARDLASLRPSSIVWPSNTGLNKSSRNWSTSDAWLGTLTLLMWDAIDGASEVSDIAEDLTSLLLPPDLTNLGLPCLPCLAISKS